MDSNVERKCPSCQELVKQYLITGIYLPIEELARGTIKHTMDIGFQPFIPICDVSPNEMIILTLSSVCSKCGYISTWAINEEEAKNIYSKNIGWVYNPEKIKNAIDNVPENLSEIKRRLETILFSANFFYKKEDTEE